MPKESRLERTFTYSKEEIQQILMEDLLSRNVISQPCGCSDIIDVQVKIGDVPRGNLDSDPIYGFGGIRIVVQE